MADKRSIVVGGYGHGSQPIPAAARVGPLLMTGGVHGIDRSTGKLADGLEAQVAHMMANLQAILEAGGAGWADVVKITIYAGVPEARAVLNAAWIERFPDAADRPARHTRPTPDLPAGMLIQCDAVAYIDHARYHSRSSGVTSSPSR